MNFSISNYKKMKYKKLVQKLKKHFKDGQPLPFGCMKNRCWSFLTNSHTDRDSKNLYKW